MKAKLKNLKRIVGRFGAGQIWWIVAIFLQSIVFLNG